MLSFDGAVWFSGVKIPTCEDDLSLTWVRDVITTFSSLWENAEVEMKDRSNIPSVSKAKVIIPHVGDPEQALR